MITYPIHHHKHEHKRIIQNNNPYMCTYSLKNTNINTKAHFQSSQYYMCAYSLQQQKPKHIGLLPKYPVLHVYITSIETQTYTQIFVHKNPSIAFGHALYNNTQTLTHRIVVKILIFISLHNLYKNTNINTKAD